MTAVTCRAERQPTRSVSLLRSKVTIKETFATESFGRPVADDFSNTLPGAEAHLVLLVRGDADNRPDTASVDGVTLNHQNRTPEAGR